MNINNMMIALEKAQNVARGKMRYSPADSIPAAMVESYFDDPDGNPYEITSYDYEILSTHYNT